MSEVLPTRLQPLQMIYYFFLKIRLLQSLTCLKTLMIFGSCLIFKYIFLKSTALNISLSKDICKLCTANFPFTWNNRAISYLGIQLPASLSDLYSLNYTPLLNKILADLKKWSSGLFSWFGRAAIIKMNILPRILYVLQTILIKIPQAFFSSYRKACTVFIWNKLRSRLGYNRLTAPKIMGGIGLPDIRKYHQACCLNRIVD